MSSRKVQPSEDIFPGDTGGIQTWVRMGRAGVLQGGPGLEPPATPTLSSWSHQDEPTNPSK